MKKLITLLAIVAMSATASASKTTDKIKDDAEKMTKEYKDGELRNAPPILKEGVGAVAIVGGNTVYYGTTTLEILGDGGYDLVNASVASSKCANDGTYANEHAACYVDLGGQYVSIIADSTLEAGANVVYYVAEAPGDVLEMLDDSFAQCAAYAKENIAIKYADKPCAALAFTFGLGGELIKTTGLIVGNAVETGGDTAVATVEHLIELPSSLLRGQWVKAGKALPKSFLNLACGITKITLGSIGEFFGWILGEETVQWSCRDEVNKTVDGN